MRSHRVCKTVVGPIAVMLAALAFPFGASAQVDAPSNMLIDFDGDGTVTAEELLIRDIWIADDGLLSFLLDAIENSGTSDDGIVDISDYLETHTSAGAMTGGDSQIDGPSDSCYLTWTCCFLRGDTNGDYGIDAADLMNVMGIVSGNETTATYVANLDSCDVDDNGLLNEDDITYLSQYLYQSGPQPPQPFPYRGTDPTPDTILAPCTDQYDKESEMNPLDRAEIALPPAETPGFPQDLLPEQPVEPIDGTGGLGALGPDLPVFPGPGGLAWGCRPSYKTRHTVRGLEAAWGDMDTEQGANWFSGVPHLSQARDGTYWVRWSANCVRQYQATATLNVFAGKYTNMTSLVYDPVNNEFLLHDLAGRVYVFYGYANGTVGQSPTIPRSVKGRIKRIEGIGGTLNGGTVVKPRVSFAWDPWSGCLDKVEVISSDDEANPCQTWDYAFTNPPALRIEQVEFRRPNGAAPLLIVFRHYSVGMTEEGGTEGDLMQIDVRTSLSPTSELSAPAMIARTYYYRYYINTWADADGARGYPHQVRFFYGPDACKEFLTASYKTDALSGLEDREYEYCVDRRPKTLSVKGGCAGCGGGGTGDYAYTWYLGKAIAAAAVNESHVKVSIALANDDVYSSRRVLVFNAFGQKLIDAACVKETEQSAELSWVWAGVYTTLTGGQWCLQDKFWPSACGSFDPSAGAALDCAASGTNPVFSGNGGLSAYVSGTGKHQMYSYGWALPYFDLTMGYSQAQGSTPPTMRLRMELLSSGDRMRWVRKQIQDYEADGVTHHDTTYNYTSFHAEDALAFKDVRVDHPIVSPGNNGSGATVSECSWYNEFGLPVWMKDGNGRVGYTKYDAVYDAGAGNAVTWLARAVVEDINTDSPPPGVTPGTPPSGFESSGADRINALTEITADGLCRAVAVTSPGGQTGHLVYAKLASGAEKLSADVSIVLAYPHVENNVPFGEVAITGSTPGGKTCLSAKAYLPGDPGGAEDFFYKKDWRWGSEPAELHEIFDEGCVTGRLLERREVAHFYDGADGHRIAKERAWPDPYQSLSYYDANYVKYTRTTHYNAEGLPARIEGRETGTAGGLTGFRQSEWRTYDPLGRPSTVAIGASDADKVIVSRSYYDGGEGETGTTLKVGDGHLTLQVGYLGDAADGENEAGMTARKAKRVCNWRGFQTETWEGYDAAAGTALRVSRFAFDNQGRETLAERFVTDTSAANLRGKTATAYDERGRKCRTVEYGVDQGTGAVQANTLTTGIWYDPAGNVMKVKMPDGTFRKSSYDGLNRVVAEYLSYQISEADTDYAAAGNVTGDTVVEQAERGYDTAANLIKVVTYLRNHDATATGALTATVARREYRWFWHDALGRIKTEGFYGTNGGVEMTVRPAEPSATGATVLVTKHAYSSDVSAVERWQATAAVDGRIEGAAMDAFGQARRQWVKSRSTSDHKITDFTHDAASHVIARTVYQETLSSTSTPPAGTPGGASTTAYDWGLMRAYSDGNWSENHISSTELLRQVRRPIPDGEEAGNPSDTDARFFAYNALGEARALWTRRGANSAVGREAVYDSLGRKTSEVVRDDYEAGSNALEWDYDLFDRITAARSLDGATPAAVLNEVTTSFGPYGETVAVRQEHDGSVSEEEEGPPPCATAQYSGPGTTYGLRRPTNQYFKKTSGSTTAAEAEIAYDYGTAGGIDDMLTRPVRQRYFQYPYAAASEFRVDEFYLGARAWVRSESRQGAPSFALRLTQEIPSYQSVSGGLDRFGRTVLFKAWCNVKTWPLRRTWEYDATTGLLTAKRDYMKKTTGPEFALAAWVNTYDGFSRTTDVNYDYAQDTGPSWQWVDQELDDAHWLYDGADGITHFSGDGATAYPSRTLNRREEIATIDNTPAVVLYTEAGEVRYQDYPLHGVADRYYFFDAWGRMCGHGTPIVPNEPPKPATELEVYVTYDALGRVIVRTEDATTDPVTTHYYYDLQGNRAWEGPDAETVARVHFHSLYSGRNFALMGSAYYVVDPGDGAAMLCNSDGSFKQVLSTYPTGEPHPITVYGAQEVEALLAGGNVWDAGAKAIGGPEGAWLSTVLRTNLGDAPSIVVHTPKTGTGGWPFYPEIRIPWTECRLRVDVVELWIYRGMSETAPQLYLGRMDATESTITTYMAGLRFDASLLASTLIRMITAGAGLTGYVSVETASVSTKSTTLTWHLWAIILIYERCYRTDEVLECRTHTPVIGPAPGYGWAFTAVSEWKEVMRIQGLVCCTGEMKEEATVVAFPVIPEFPEGDPLATIDRLRKMLAK